MQMNLRSIVGYKKPYTNTQLLYDSLYVKCPAYTNPYRYQIDKQIPRAWSAQTEKTKLGVTANGYQISLWNDSEI